MSRCPSGSLYVNHGYLGRTASTPIGLYKLDKTTSYALAEQKRMHGRVNTFGLQEAIARRLRTKIDQHVHRFGFA